jgi:hypothetical protein
MPAAGTLDIAGLLPLRPTASSDYSWKILGAVDDVGAVTPSSGRP